MKFLNKLTIFFNLKRKTKKEPSIFTVKDFERRKKQASKILKNQKFDLKRIVELAGILEPPAKYKVCQELISEEYHRLRSNSCVMDKIRSEAKSQALRQIKGEEYSVVLADEMTKYSQTLCEFKEQLEKQWNEYLGIGKRRHKATASNFTDFLLKNKYLNEKQLNAMRVSATFIDGKITNFRKFYTEMLRTKLPISD